MEIFPLSVHVTVLSATNATSVSCFVLCSHYEHGHSLIVSLFNVFKCKLLILYLKRSLYILYRKSQYDQYSHMKMDGEQYSG